MKDSIWNHNPAKFVKECKRLRALCQRIIDGEEGVIEGAEKGQTLQFVLGGRGRDGGAVAPPFTAPDDGKKLNTPSVVVRGTAEAGSLVTVDHADNTVGTVVAQGAGADRGSNLAVWCDLEVQQPQR